MKTNREEIWFERRKSELIAIIEMFKVKARLIAAESQSPYDIKDAFFYIDDLKNKIIPCETLDELYTVCPNNFFDEANRQIKELFDNVCKDKEQHIKHLETTNDQIAIAIAKYDLAQFAKKRGL